MFRKILATFAWPQLPGANKPIAESNKTPPEPSEDEYTIGWVCALLEEYTAAHSMLDVKFNGPRTSKRNDNNMYAFGKIYDHNVVITCLPDGEWGTNCAASVAKDMVRSFPELRFALMVGIGGGAPTKENDVRRGDVVVSTPRGTLGGVVQLDLIKRLSVEGKPYDQRMGFLSPPPRVLRTSQQEVRRRYDDPDLPDRIAKNMARMAHRLDFRRPIQDRLYRADYEHEGGPNCNNCNTDNLEEWNQRDRMTDRVVRVHYGMIGSSNSLIESAEERDRYARDPDLKILCFETEAAGLMNTYPCLVIRGISHYSDSHKNDEWNNYAALSAAAYAREILSVLKPERVNDQEPWAGLREDDCSAIGILFANEDGVNPPDTFNHAPLSTTVAEGNSKVTDILPDCSANTSLGHNGPEHGNEGFGSRDQSGPTRLRLVAQGENEALAALLFREDGNADSRHFPRKAVAAGSGTATVEIPLRWKDVDLTAEDKDGETALHHAAKGQVGVVKLLLEYGADADAVDGAGQHQTA